MSDSSYTLSSNVGISISTNATSPPDIPICSSSTSAAPSSSAASTNAPSSLSAYADSQSSGSISSSSTPASGDEQKDTPGTPTTWNTSILMEIDSTATPHTAAAAAAPSPSAASTKKSGSAMEVDGGDVNGNEYLRTQIKCIEVEQKKSAEGVLRHLSKMLAALKKSPNLLATRKFRADNIAVKKFVMDVSGALAIAKYVGFQQVELTEKKVPYLIVEESTLNTSQNKMKLDEAIDAVNNALAVYDAPAGSVAAAAAAPAAEKKLCEGGCGFFGSPDTEGFCSLCFKKRFLTGTGPISPSKSSNSANPFTTPPKGTGSVGATAASIAAAGASQPSASAAVSGDKCLKHCGRVGSAATKGFCKECFDKITAQGAKAPPKRWKCLFDGALVKLRAVHRFNLGKKPVQEAKNRCWTCNKKIGITGFQCRCNYVFCAAHRYEQLLDYLLHITLNVMRSSDAQLCGCMCVLCAGVWENVDIWSSMIAVMISRACIGRSAYSHTHAYCSVFHSITHILFSVVAVLMCFIGQKLKKENEEIRAAKIIKL
jgi:hypothetical protein